MAISTPCIGICVLDEEAGFCAGCGRTGEEIAGWLAMSEERRRAIMAGLPARLEACRASAAPARGEAGAETRS